MDTKSELNRIKHILKKNLMNYKLTQLRLFKAFVSNGTWHQSVKLGGCWCHDKFSSWSSTQVYIFLSLPANHHYILYTQISFKYPPNNNKKSIPQQNPKSKGKITNLLWLLQSKNTTKQQFKFRIASCLHTLTQSQSSYPFHHGSMCTCCISRRCVVQQHIQLPVRIHTHGTNKKTHNWTYICTHTTKHTLGFYITWKFKLSTQMHNLCVKTDTWWLSLIYWYHYHLNIHFRFRLHLAEFTTRFV